MTRVEEFELETILSMTTKYSWTDDFDKVFKLVWFVCNDPFINSYGLGMVRDEVKNNLLTIHPELKDVKYKKGQDIKEALKEAEEKYGKTLPVTQLGEKIPEEYKTKESQEKCLRLTRRNN